MTSHAVPHRALAWVTLALALTVTASCVSGGDDEKSAKPPSGGADPCRLVTKAEVLAHLNLPPRVRPGDLGSTDFIQFPPIVPEPVGMRYCAFGNEKPHIVVHVGVSAGLAKEVFSRWKREAKKMGRELDLVKGIGDEAIWFVERHTPTKTSEGLLVRKGDKMLAVTMVVPESQTRRARATRLARVALARV